MATFLVDEARRIAALHETEILDSLPEQPFDDVTELAALICGTPVAQISFVDSHRQWIKASKGLEAKECPRSFSFCSHTVHTGMPLLVPDSLVDERFKDNPLVQGSPHIRSYAGAPIIDGGHVLGTVCVIDTAPRTLTPAQISGLSALARQVVTLLTQRKMLISEKKQADAALSHTQASLRLTAERLQLSQAAGRIASWEWDLITNEITWGGGTEWVYGRPASELASLDLVLPLIHPDDLAAVMESMRPALDGLSDFSTEFRVLWPDGSVHWSHSFGRPMLSRAGKPLQIVGVHMDITERKLAQESLLKTEKVAAVGRLASSIAHEINNPLASITNLMYLARESETMPEVRDFLALAQEELLRVSEIVNQTLLFYRHAAFPQSVLPEAIISGVLRLQQTRIYSLGVNVERKDRATKPVLCFEGEMRQVVANLVGNSLDAMSTTSGRLLLRTREATDWRTGRAGVVITVADTGSGMSKAVAAGIFTPFFTTKGDSRAGLGLWVSKEIVERHKGRLFVRSREASERHSGPTGTVFNVFLPYQVD